MPRSVCVVIVAVGSPIFVPVCGGSIESDHIGCNCVKIRCNELKGHILPLLGLGVIDVHDTGRGYVKGNSPTDQCVVRLELYPDKDLKRAYGEVS
jgi:hypothetical protein